MRTPCPLSLLLASAILFAAAPSLAQEGGGEGPVSGRITTDGAEVEILPAPPRVGERVEIQGGWYRIESGEEEAGRTGSFSVVAPRFLPQVAGPEAAPAPRQQDGGWEADDRMISREARRSPGVARRLDQRRVAAEHPCHQQRQRVARELFRIAGVWHFDRPLDWLEALREDPVLSLSPWVRFNLFGITAGGPLGVDTGVDPIRAVGWDEGLRWAADDLLSCLDDHR